MPIYNNGFPVNYPQHPTYQTQTQNQIPANNMQVQNKSGINWVQGEAGARSFWVAPNDSALLMDSEKDCFYIKSVDASGVPLPLRIFDYSERKTDVPVAPQVAQPVAEQPQIDLSRFMTRDLEILDKILDEIKDAETICAMRESADREYGYSRGNDGYSRGGQYSRGDYAGDYSGRYSYNRYSNGMEHDGMSNGSYGYYYDDMNSHRRYRSPSTGRYTSNRPNYSREDMNERMVGQLERMMGETQNEQAKQALADAIERMGR